MHNYTIFNLTRTKITIEKIYKDHDMSLLFMKTKNEIRYIYRD